MIVSEVLSFISFYLDKTTAEHIKKITLGFYTPDEIIEAKKILWTNYKDNISFVYQDRKSTDKRSACEANIDDILKALGDLDIASVPILFVAVQLNRIPSCNPEELNLTYLLERVNNIEKQLKSHNEVLCTQRIDLLNIQDKQEIFEKKIENKLEYNPLSNNSHFNNIQTAELQSDLANVSFSTDHPFEENVISSIYRNSDDKEILSADNQGEKNIRRRFFSENDVINLDCKKIENDMPNTNSVLSGDAKDLRNSNNNIDKNKRHILNKPKNYYKSRIFTTKDNYSRENYWAKNSSNNLPTKSNNKGRLLGAPAPYRDIFIYRVINGNELDIINYCKNKGIFVKECKQLSHPASTYKSFKLSVLLGQVNLTLQDNFWPNGIKSKKFVTKTRAF